MNESQLSKEVRQFTLELLYLIGGSIYFLISTWIKLGDKIMIQVNKETAVPFHFYLIYIVINQFHTREAPSGITRTHYSELEWLHGNQYLDLFKIGP